LILLDGKILMTSAARRSEEALATLACSQLPRRRAPRVLIGGLGMGYTLRAALDALPEKAKLLVAELHPVVEAWCRGPLAELTAGAVFDPRVSVQKVDVADVIDPGNERPWDGILLDLFQGPGTRADDPHFGSAALERTRAALCEGGILGVWTEQHDPGFVKRARKAGFQLERHRPGKGGLRHIVYIGRAGGIRAAGTRGDRRRESERRHRS
jgi:spermidine synthase